MNVEFLNFQKLFDNRGKLIVIEEINNVPFDIKRIYYMFDTCKDVKRGFHAHKKLKQIAIAIKGECKILLDDGTSKLTIRLNDPTKGLVLEPLIWHEMFDYSADCILMVIANDVYDESDYIRNINEFYEIVKNDNP